MGAGASTSITAGTAYTYDTAKAAYDGLTEDQFKELAGGDTATRYNEKRENPEGATYKLAVVQFKVPGNTKLPDGSEDQRGGSDKGPDGNRIDSIPIANGVIHAGGACDLLLFNAEDFDGFVKATAPYHALIVRINPGQLSQGTPDGTQAKFDGTLAAARLPKLWQPAALPLRRAHNRRTIFVVTGHLPPSPLHCSQPMQSR